MPFQCFWKLEYGTLCRANILSRNLFYCQCLTLFFLGIPGPSSVLQSAMVPVIPIARCRLHHRVTQQNICSGTPKTGACRGDSGGPLMYEFQVDKSYRYFIIGIVSYGEEVCVRSSPTVFAKVSFFTKWILDNIHP